ncbi:hypothetical protein HHI36_022073 [Cryptolaemus montrouzieri]|uniref:Ionotropic receptor n=1 Tax=Cryptolaemus montrouzieri TaxID=559131 RepID=A0ABD2MYU0_9CUCU
MDNSVEYSKNYSCRIYGNENMESIKKMELTVHFFYAPPFTFCENCENKGISLEIITMALESLKIKRKFKGIFFMNFNMKTLAESIFSENNSDIFVGLPPFVEYDFTQPFLYSNAYWIVRSPNEIPRWRYLIRIFSTEVWIVWILSSIVLSLMWFAIMSKKTYNRRTLQQSTEGLFIIFKHFIEQPHYLKPSSIPQIIVLTTILISTFLMNLFFDSKFSYFLTGFNYEKSINSFDDLMENKLEVQLPDYFLEHFNGDTKALEYFEKYRTGTRSTLKIVVEENKAVVYPEGMFLYEYQNFLDAYQRPLVRRLNAPVETLFMRVILRKGNPLTKPLNEKLIHLVEHGFANYIHSKYKSHKTIRDKTLDVRTLTLDHIHLPLVLWIIGILLGIICFLCELKF